MNKIAEIDGREAIRLAKWCVSRFLSRHRRFEHLREDMVGEVVAYYYAKKHLYNPTRGSVATFFRIISQRPMQLTLARIGYATPRGGKAWVEYSSSEFQDWDAPTEDANEYCSLQAARAQYSEAFARVLSKAKTREEFQAMRRRKALLDEHLEGHNFQVIANRIGRSRQCVSVNVQKLVAALVENDV